MAGDYPGDGPSWTTPPSDLDPTTSWNLGRVPGASANLYTYDYQPVTDIVAEMKVTLDAQERKVLADQVIRIMMGVDPEHGLEGVSPSIGVMNPISRSVTWPWYHPPAEVYQFAHSGHHFDRVWIDTTHPDYPA